MYLEASLVYITLIPYTDLVNEINEIAMLQSNKFSLKCQTSVEMKTEMFSLRDQYHNVRVMAPLVHNYVILQRSVHFMCNARPKGTNYIQNDNSKLHVL